MKIRVETTFDTENGEYEMRFFNVSHPGDPMDYSIIKDMLYKISMSLFKKVESGINDDNEDMDGFYNTSN